MIYKFEEMKCLSLFLIDFIFDHFNDLASSFSGHVGTRVLDLDNDRITHSNFHLSLQVG